MRSIITATILVFIASFPAMSETYLSDGFESGDLSSPTTNGSSSWGATNNHVTDYVGVSDDIAHAGTRSLKFTFAGNASESDDAWAEQRLDSLPASAEIWARMWIYIPTNYYHRNVAPNNNKFWAIYAKPYETPGFQVNLSTYAWTSGGSGLALHTINNGAEQTAIDAYPNFITSSDFGTWMEIIVRVKVSTGPSSADGIIQVWKNGTRIANYTSLNIYGNNGRNYINQIYLLGWSNSGFNQTTTMYVDDVTLGSDVITAASATPIAAPAPAGLNVTNPQ